MARLITVADARYVEYLRRMLNSAKKNLPAARPYVVLVNVRPNLVEDIQKEHSDTEFVFESVTFENDTQKKCYCTNRRASLLRDLAGKTSEFLIWLDADSIIRKPCPDLLDMDAFDIAVKPKCVHDMRRGRKPSGVMAGLIVVNPTAASQTFLTSYDELVGRKSWQKVRNIKCSKMTYLPRDVMKIWMANQTYLGELSESLASKLRIRKLSNQYLDTSLQEGSFIWSLKASSGPLQRQRFQKEAGRFL